jgi:hypothetical protein
MHLDLTGTSLSRRVTNRMCLFLTISAFFVKWCGLNPSSAANYMTFTSLNLFVCPHSEDCVDSWTSLKLLLNPSSLTNMEQLIHLAPPFPLWFKKCLLESSSFPSFVVSDYFIISLTESP